MSYLLKKFPKLPYTALVALSPISWGLLCTVFGYILILSRANFEATNTRMIFAIGTPIYMIIAAILSVVKYGGFSFFKTKERRKKLEVLNKNIKQGHINPKVSTKTLKEMFSSLAELPVDGFATSIRYGSIVMLLAFAVEWFIGGKTINLLVILIGGAISMFLLALFITFFAQRFIFSTLKECRALLKKRREEIKEPQFRFNNLRTKFKFFLLIPILVVLVILGLVSTIDLGIIAISLVGLIMAIMVSQQLSSSIYDAFLGIKDFAKDLPTKTRTSFSTGSLDTEIIDLSGSLNKAADEVYSARNKVEKSERELRKRFKELERWYRLTVGREMKMTELKQELKKLKTLKKTQ